MKICGLEPTIMIGEWEEGARYTNSPHAVSESAEVRVVLGDGAMLNGHISVAPIALSDEEVGFLATGGIDFNSRGGRFAPETHKTRGDAKSAARQGIIAQAVELEAARLGLAAEGLWHPSAGAKSAS